MLFKPGTIVATPGALDLAEQGLEPACLSQAPSARRLGRPVRRRQSREQSSLRLGFRLLSAYETPFGKLWIITEADRSATTFLCPTNIRRSTMTHPSHTRTRTSRPHPLGQHARVLAVAGSGKSTTMAHRIKHLVKTATSARIPSRC